MVNTSVADNNNVTFYDSIVLQMINNKALASGLIDEKTKLNIDGQIQRRMPAMTAK